MLLILLSTRNFAMVRVQPGSYVQVEYHKKIGGIQSGACCLILLLAEKKNNIGLYKSISGKT